MAKGLRSASSILSKMKYQPTKQLEAQRFDQQEGMDNRAVSQRDRFLGKQVAEEQERLMKLDEIGEEISTRRDKLAFNKKITGKKLSMAEEKLRAQDEQFGSEMDLKRSTFETDKLFQGIEFGIGMLSTPINTYNRIQTRKQNKELAAQQKRMLGLQENELSRRAQQSAMEDQSSYDIDWGYVPNNLYE